MTIRSILRRYYGVWAIYSFGGGFLYGVYPLFLRSRGLDQFQMNSVLAAYFFVTFLTDVPTGAFADALGRRRSFVLGCALRFAAFLTYFFAHHYAFFLIAESIDGIGTTFCNGAIDAWGVDALDAGGYARPKDRLFLARLAAQQLRLYAGRADWRLCRRHRYRVAMAARRRRLLDRRCFAASC